MSFNLSIIGEESWMSHDFLFAGMASVGSSIAVGHTALATVTYSTTTTTNSIPGSSPTTSLELTYSPITCEEGIHDADWIDKWSAGKRKYCCSLHHWSCDTANSVYDTSTTTTTVSFARNISYNCQSGLSNSKDDWQQHPWSLAKKNWCCLHEMLGCWNEYAQTPHGRSSTFHETQAGAEFLQLSAPMLLSAVLALSFVGVTFICLRGRSRMEKALPARPQFAIARRSLWALRLPVDTPANIANSSDDCRETSVSVRFEGDVAYTYVPTFV